jgi:hypothetical protein
MDTQIRDTLLAVKNAVSDPAWWVQRAYSIGERRCVLGWVDRLTERASQLREPLYLVLGQAAWAHIKAHRCVHTYGDRTVGVNDQCGHAGVMDMLDRALLATAPVLPEAEPAREMVAV